MSQRPHQTARQPARCLRGGPKGILRVRMRPTSQNLVDQRVWHQGREKASGGRNFEVARIDGGGDFRQQLVLAAQHVAQMQPPIPSVDFRIEHRVELPKCVDDLQSQLRA